MGDMDYRKAGLVIDCRISALFHSLDVISLSFLGGCNCMQENHRLQERS